MGTVASSPGRLLVNALIEAGVDTVFGLVSVHNLPLVEEVRKRLRFVPVRHEAGAVNAADAYARSRGGLGCAITSTGTGAGNAAGSMIEALAAGSPVLHVTGQVETEYLGSMRGALHETRDQLAMLAAVSKSALSITARTDVPALLRAAVACAQSAPSGPVSIEWPIDLQYSFPDAPGLPLLQPDPLPDTPVADPESIREAVELLASARRPVIWCGGGALACGSELQTLVELLGAGLLTSNSGRGLVPEDHPLCIGNFATSPAARDLLSDADVLLSIGTHFRSNETADYQLALPDTHIQIDVDPAALGRSYTAQIMLSGLAETLVPDLLARLANVTAGTDDWRKRVRAVRVQVRRDLRATLGAQGEVCDALRAALPRDAIIARDVTIPSSAWGNRLLEIYKARTNIFAKGGGIGQGLGMGLGAAIGNPAVPTLVIAGDGGLAVHLGELLTVVQEQPWLVVMVFNDGGYGVLRNVQDKYFPERVGVDLATPDFERLAAAVGMAYSSITGAPGAGNTIAAAIELRKPVLIEVDVVALGPMKVPFTPPVTVRIHRS